MKISQKELLKLLIYDPDTGKLFWLSRDLSMFNSKRDYIWWNNRFANKEAFTSDNGDGYKVGSINGKNFKAHKVIWLLVYGETPKDQIDHINGDRSDNRLENLRMVSFLDNMKNQKMRSTNTSGHTGVYWYKRYDKWVAKINQNNKQITVGYFISKEDAIRARKMAEEKYNYHLNHGRFVEL